jgi:hypothetical protein
MKTTLLVAGILLSVFASGQQVAKGLTASNGTFIGFYQYTPVDYNATGEKYRGTGQWYYRFAKCSEQWYSQVHQERPQNALLLEWEMANLPGTVTTA